MTRGHRRYALVVEVVILVAVFSLASGLRAQDTSASRDRSVLDGVFTASQASRGKGHFQRACASCHELGEHTGRRFGARWAGSSMGDLFDLVSATMPDGNPGSLEAEEYASILAFFLGESGYREGETDLPSDLESLGKIRIEPLPR